MKHFQLKKEIPFCINMVNTHVIAVLVDVVANYTATYNIMD